MARAPSGRFDRQFRWIVPTSRTNQDPRLHAKKVKLSAALDLSIVAAKTRVSSALISQHRQRSGVTSGAAR